MPISWSLKVDVPANTAQSAAKKDERDIPAGVHLTSIKLHIASGHAGLCPVQFQHNGHVVLPNDRNDYRLDDVPNAELLDAPVTLRQSGKFSLVAWNSDDTHQHTPKALVSGHYRDECRPGMPCWGRR